MLRTRPVAGDARLSADFQAVRGDVLANHVQRDSLQADVVEMRQKMRAELNVGSDDQFDLKQGPGGVTDIEFIVQYLVLKEAGRHPSLTIWPDNIRQLEALAAAHILSDTDAGSLADAYRDFRSRLHRLALAGNPQLVAPDEISVLAEGVRAIWQREFGTG